MIRYVSIVTNSVAILKVFCTILDSLAVSLKQGVWGAQPRRSYGVFNFALY